MGILVSSEKVQDMNGKFKFTDKSVLSFYEFQLTEKHYPQTLMFPSSTLLQPRAPPPYYRVLSTT